MLVMMEAYTVSYAASTLMLVLVVMMGVVVNRFSVVVMVAALYKSWNNITYLTPILSKGKRTL